MSLQLNDLNLDLIESGPVRDALNKIKEFVQANTFLKSDMKVLSLSFKGAVTAIPVAHGLGFVPRDYVILRSEGAGTFTLLPLRFDQSNIYVTTTNACNVRVLIGRF